jgi:hypothetical protein
MPNWYGLQGLIIIIIIIIIIIRVGGDGDDGNRCVPSTLVGRCRLVPLPTVLQPLNECRCVL